MRIIYLTLLIFNFFLISANLKIVRAAASVAPSAGDFTSWITTATPNFVGGTVGSIISALIPYIFGIAGFLILIFIVLGGYQVLFSQGDPKQMAAGKDKITWAVVGFIVMFTAFWLVQLIGRILNIQKIIDIFG